MKSDIAFTLENAGWPALLVDGTATIVRANQAAVKILGPVVEGESPLLSAIWASENGSPAEQFLAQWERSPTATVKLKFRIKGGGIGSYSVSICSFMKDGQRFFTFQLLPQAASDGDTSFHVAEMSLAQRQKLDCALQLARTVALDFNNVLTSILGHASLLVSMADQKHPWRVSLMEIEKSAARAAEIANDLAAFSRQGRDVRGQPAGNLNSIIQRTVELVQTSRAAKVDWTMQLGGKLFAAKFDEAKIQQVFVKVVENAVESVGPVGRVTVQTRNIELAEPAQDRNLRLAPGTYVCVEVSDNGCGVAPDILPRIFEPFFTTKKDGNHRGLGLALVYGIVSNHGGGVAVSSQPGAGTSVRIYLPAENKISRDTNLQLGDLNGSETILMVDDEDLMLTMAQTVLSAFGYRVVTANSGQKALEILERDATAIDLLITDLVMPTMSGRELVEHVRRLSPAIHILCTSGFLGPSSDNNSMIYLQKPFTSQELLVKVRQALTNGVEYQHEPAADNAGISR